MAKEYGQNSGPKARKLGAGSGKRGGVVPERAKKKNGKFRAK